ncbi:MAG: hypothetical protein HRT88_09945 [Lentisphaeraceae bacterium]|nr:hypothetical protein [Lentisphaeraceae bacterium]
MKLLMLSFLLLFTGACATGMSSNETSVIIDSQPNGQKFTVTNAAGKIIHAGVTPETVMLDTSAGFFKAAKHRLKLSGKSFELEAKMSIFYYGNVFGFVGFAVDPLTGSMWNLPDSVTVSNGNTSTVYSVDTVK